MSTTSSYHTLFEKQQNYQFAIARTNWKERSKKLKRLQHALEDTFRDRIREALYKDFKKPELETDMSEIYPVIREIKMARRYLRQWMKPERASTPFLYLGATSSIEREPKGVCLIISPWNYPVNLTLAPLVSAIAAGNTCIIKPSEYTPHTSAVIAELISSLFPPEEILVLEGDAKVAENLLQLPFNHIFFTGSPAVGKIIMEAASRHLSSVTLELGGKSPVIIDRTCNLKKAAKRVAWAKTFNAGQTCIAPDYVWVDSKIEKEFIQLVIKYWQEFFGSEQKHMAHIVNKKHQQRLTRLLSATLEQGAILETGGGTPSDELYLEPTLISGINLETPIMQEEIFGPVLPVIAFNSAEEVVQGINQLPRPLALYIFSKSQKFIDHLMAETRAGSTCINHLMIQFTNEHLPFGGINNSGFGKSHGKYGFNNFSNERSVVRQYTLNAADLIVPPYSRFKKRLADIALRWF